VTGLREKQKADRTRRILRAALAQFRAEGYEAVRIEDIAAAAEVSAGTCYNYFSTKGDILLAIVSMEVEEVVEAGRSVVDDPPQDIAQAFDRLVTLYFDHSLHYLSKEMWRMAMSLSIGAPDSPFSQRYTALDAMLAAQVCSLIAALQARGLARPDIDAGAAGLVLFNNLNQLFTEFVKDEAMTLDSLHAQNRQTTVQLARLMAAGPPG
jgi:AcrR family transcriptional regulator